MENQRKVAIIGAGVSGLLSAKYAKENGFTPTIFEKNTTVGGQWSGEVNAWPNLESNVSKYSVQLSDHYWNDEDPLFIPRERMHKWLLEYVEKFHLGGHLKFNTKVLNITKDLDQFKVTYEHEGNKHEEKFTHVIVATGFFNLPNYIGLDKYMGGAVKIEHSSQYKDLCDYKDKTVVVVGHSHSALQIAEEVSKHAKKVYNIFRQPQLIIPKHFFSKDHNKEIFVDLVSMGNREIHNLLNTLPQNEANKAVNNFILSYSKQNSHQSLYVDLSSEEPLGVGISQSYVEMVEKGLIEPIKAEIKGITGDRVELSNGQELQVDTIILGTGFKSNYFFLDECVLKELGYNKETGSLDLNVFNVFNPEVKNIAFIGNQYYSLFPTFELQVRLAFQYFGGLYKHKELKMKYNSNNKVSYNNHILRLAEQIGCEPDLEEIKIKDPELYDCLLKGPIIPQHFRLNTDNIEEFTKYSDLIKKWYRMFKEEGFKLI
jgi:dimethylaniline monooxygenase (N-oxide forming)